MAKEFSVLCNCVTCKVSAEKKPLYWFRTWKYCYDCLCEAVIEHSHRPR